MAERKARIPTADWPVGAMRQQDYPSARLDTVISLALPPSCEVSTNLLLEGMRGSERRQLIPFKSTKAGRNYGDCGIEFQVEFGSICW